LRDVPRPHDGLGLRAHAVGHRRQPVLLAAVHVDDVDARQPRRQSPHVGDVRSEEHTSELQSRSDLVCRLLLEKKKKKRERPIRHVPYHLPSFFSLLRPPPRPSLFPYTTLFRSPARCAASSRWAWAPGSRGWPSPPASAPCRGARGRCRRAAATPTVAARRRRQIGRAHV